MTSPSQTRLYRLVNTVERNRMIRFQSPITRKANTSSTHEAYQTRIDLAIAEVKASQAADRVDELRNAIATALVACGPRNPCKPILSSALNKHGEIWQDVTK